MVDHRAALDRTLRRMGHDVIGMEQYVAEGSKPVDRCKADVQAADVYVIIVAWRFSYVPGRNTSPPDGRSITEIELQEAQASGRPVLAFLLDPEAPVATQSRRRDEWRTRRRRRCIAAARAARDRLPRWYLPYA